MAGSATPTDGTRRLPVMPSAALDLGRADVALAPAKIAQAIVILAGRVGTGR